METHTPGRTLIVNADAELKQDEFLALLKTEARSGAPFRLVVELPDEAPQTTSELTKVWMAAAIDPQIPLTEISVVSKQPKLQRLVDAMSAFEQRNHLNLPVHFFRSVKTALEFGANGAGPHLAAA